MPDLTVAAPGAELCEAEYELAPNAALVLTEDGRGFVLDLGDRFYALSAVAAQMLGHVLSRGLAAAERAVAAEFDAPPERIAADLRRLIGDLSDRGVIRRRGAPPAPLRGTVGANLVAAAVAQCLRRSISPKRRALTALTASRLSLRLFGWVPTLMAWRRQFGTAATAPMPADEALIRAIDAEVRAVAARHPFAIDCKERALSCWALARACGLPASIVIGIVQYPLSGHCWCEVGASVISDEAETCARYTRVFCYG